MKNIRNKKIKLITGGLIFLGIMSSTILLGSKVSSKEPNKVADSKIENTQPTKKIDVNSEPIPADNSKDPIQEPIEVVDNDEVQRRYNDVDKKSLTYNTTMDTSKYYFYEYENGLAYYRGVHNDLKPLNDKKYASILKGYEYVDITEGIDYEKALDLVLKVLPDDIVLTRTKDFDNEAKFNFYSSSRGNFIVRLEYKKLYDLECISIGTDKDKISNISYFKEID
jgi:hypothetical protein